MAYHVAPSAKTLTQLHRSGSFRPQCHLDDGGTRGLKEPELVTAVKKSPRPVSQKTINNVLKARLDDAKLSTFDSIATALGVPLWVLFIPTLRASDLQSPNRERLAALVENYLKCKDDGRHHTETMAAGFAAKADLP